MAFLSPDRLAAMGFAALGDNVLVSDNASIHGAERIHLASHVRIDDFCILSAGEGGIRIGNHVHIAAYSSIIGKGEAVIEDFGNISSRVSIYTSSDDYSGLTMTNPTVPDPFKNVDHRPVRIGRHAIVGAGSVILPGVTLGDGTAIGALSLVNRDCAEFTVSAGAPLRTLGARSRDLLALEAEFLAASGKAAD